MTPSCISCPFTIVKANHSINFRPCLTHTTMTSNTPALKDHHSNICEIFFLLIPHRHVHPKTNHSSPTRKNLQREVTMISYKKQPYVVNLLVQFVHLHKQTNHLSNMWKANRIIIEIEQIVLRIPPRSPTYQSLSICRKSLNSMKKYKLNLFLWFGLFLQV